MKIGIFYGSTTGQTADIASEIASALGVDSANVHDVALTAADTVSQYDALILGSSTWGDGDLQDDWQGFLENLQKIDLSGKKIAIFGRGDAGSYPDTFCNAIGAIYDGLVDKGATIVGTYAPEGYDVTDSGVSKDGKFVGLAIDESDEGKNPDRIKAWTEQLKQELAA